jgi:hypothetical protein
MINCLEKKAFSTDYFNYITNYTELGPSSEANNCAATLEFKTILWTQRFITLFAGPTLHVHVSLSWARSSQSTLPHPIFDLSQHYPPTYVLTFLVISSWLSHQTFKCTHILPYLYYMTCPSHPPYFTILIILLKGYKLWSSSLCSFLQSPFMSSLFNTILLRTLDSKSQERAVGRANGYRLGTEE